MEEKEQVNQVYPIDERCKNCSLFLVVEELKKEIEQLKEEIKELKKPKKDMENSSIPSSQNRFNKKYPKREKSNLKTGGQQGHIGSNRLYFKNPDEIISLDNDVCPNCGSKHFIEKEEKIKRKQVIDIIFKPHIIEYQQKHLICSNCKRRIPTSDFTQKGNVEFSDNVKSFIGYLSVQANMSYKKIVKLFSEVLNIKISEGTIDNALEELSTNLRDKVNNILDELKTSFVIGSDETGIRINGKNQYLWVLQNEDNSYYMQGNRSYNTLSNTIDKFDGIWISDRYGGQLKMNCQHQLCLAHLIRECKYLIELENSKWAKRLKSIFEKSIHLKNSYGDRYNPNTKEIYREIKKLKKELHNILKKIPKEKESRKLWKSLVCRQHQLLLFLDDKNIPATNNSSERALRNTVLKRKVSGCHRSTNGANRYCTIATVIETAKKQCQNIFQALTPNFA